MYMYLYYSKYPGTHLCVLLYCGMLCMGLMFEDSRLSAPDFED
jgi:hypothetical protein